MVHGFDALYGVSHQLSLVTSTVSARAGATDDARRPRRRGQRATPPRLRVVSIAGFPWPPPFSFRAHWPEKNSRIGDGQLRVAAPCLNEQVDADGDDDDEAERRLLYRRGHVEHDETALDDLHDERADERLADRAAAAEQAGAADHDGGDRDELEAHSRDRLRRAEPRGEDEPREAAEEAADRIDAELHQLDVDARCPRRVLVAADRIDVAAEAGPVEDQRGDERHRKQNDDRESGSARSSPGRARGTKAAADRSD